MATRKSIKPLMPQLGSTPAKPTVFAAVSMQALSTGTADAEQQKQALKWIVEEACGDPVWAYRESDRETCIALGRQFVAQQIVSLIRANISTLRALENG